MHGRVDVQVGKHRSHYANDTIALISESWLGPDYQVTLIEIENAHHMDEASAELLSYLIGEIERFIIAIGPISSIFDYTTYAVMYFLFGASTPAQAALFQTGWFVESLMTQTLIIHVIRTNKIPFLQSHASWPLVATTVAVMAVGLWLPVSPLAPALGFVPLPGLYWPILALTLVCWGVTRDRWLGGLVATAVTVTTRWVVERVVTRSTGVRDSI